MREMNLFSVHWAGDELITTVFIPSDASAQEAAERLAEVVNIEDDDYVKFTYVGDGVTDVWVNGGLIWELKQIT